MVEILSFIQQGSQGESNPRTRMRSEDEYLHDELLDFTIIGASYIAKGVTEFSAWSKAMLAEKATESLRPFLRVVYANSKTDFTSIPVATK
jgi:hypothetical protein